MPPQLSAQAYAPATSAAVFVPIATCRIADTRAGTGVFAKPLPVDTTRNLKVSGSAGFAAQGGNPSGCGVPASATAVAASIVAVSPSGSGAIRAWASGGSVPSGTALRFNKATVSHGQSIAVRPGGGNMLSIRGSGAKTDVAIDINGYYAPQLHALIGPSGSVYSGSSRILSATIISTGQYTVTFDQDVSFYTPTVGVFGGVGIFASAATEYGKVRVFTWYVDSITHESELYNAYFYISVVC